MYLTNFLNKLKKENISYNRHSILGKKNTFTVNFNHNKVDYSCECYFLSSSSGSGNKSKLYLSREVNNDILAYAKILEIPFLLIFNLSGTDKLYAVNLKDLDYEVNTGIGMQRISIPLTNELTISKDSISSFI